MENSTPGTSREWMSGRLFLLGGIGVFLLLAFVALMITMSGDTVEADREWWGTPTPTNVPGALPFR